MSPASHSGGMAQVLRVAIPLIMASSGHALRLFADRVMLAWYSPTAIAAAMPAGLACFCLMCFFLGTAGYASTFVAQYAGAGERKRIGLSIWQGVYIALAGGVVVGLCAPAARFIFEWMGHGPEVIEQQIVYFEVLARLSFAPILLAALLGFWSGRGRTVVVMLIELFCALANVVLNYMLIFGHWGCPEMGIEGAGLATGFSAMLGLAVALVLFLAPGSRARFGTWPRRTFDPALFRRVLRFGSPSGIQFALDLIAFNLFVVLLGRLGQVELEAANLAFAVNALVYLPLVGLGTSVTILVGQAVGARQPDHARRSVRSALGLAFIYNTLLGGAMLLLPEWILQIFAREGDPGQIEAFKQATIYMRFITLYLIFDGLYIIYSHAVRGAGDTRFAMAAGIMLSWGTLVLPSFVAHWLGAPATVLWSILVGHVLCACTLFYLRYRGGKWTRMRVI